MGAFFVRRNSGNPLYRRVLERYVNMSTRAGVCQAVFLEGSLSKDGALREPRRGFLDYMLRDYHPGIDREITFIPVGINYDRVIEDRSLIRTLNSAVFRRSTWFILKTALRFISKTLMLSRQNRWNRFGYASVNFGQPVSTRLWCERNSLDFSKSGSETRIEQVGRLAQHLMQEIQQVIPVLPVALMAEILLASSGGWKSALELKTAVLVRIEELKRLGAPIRIPSNTCEAVLGNALAALVGRRMVEAQDGLYRAEANSSGILSYYANSIAHWRSPDRKSDPIQ